MTVSFNVGPSQLGPGVAEDIAEIVGSGLLSLSHRSDDVKNVVLHAVAATKTAMGIPEEYGFVFQPSATAAMETILTHCVQQQSVHLVQGAFGRRFAETPISAWVHARRLSLETPWDQVPTSLAVTEDWSDVVTVTHNETSTGLMWPARSLRMLRDAMEDEALLVVDVTSSFGAMAMDWSVGDVWFSSVQKCLGLPAGLGFIILSPRALDRVNEIERFRRPGIAAYRSLPQLLKRIASGQTVETPNILGIALLGRVMARWDLEQVEERVRRHSGLILFADLGEEYYVPDPEWRSLTVHNVRMADPDAVYERALAAGYVLGRGYGKLREECIRIANFPAHTTEQIDGLIEALL